MAVPIPTASLRIATELPLLTEYFHPGHETGRADLEDTIKNEMNAVVAPHWASWEAVTLPQAHPLESEVLHEIKIRIDTVVGPPTLRLKDGTGARPTRVRYIWRRGRRIRVHTYALEIDRTGGGVFEPWVVDHTPGGGGVVTVTCSAELSWETNV